MRQHHDQRSHERVIGLVLSVVVVLLLAGAAQVALDIVADWLPEPAAKLARTWWVLTIVVVLLAPTAVAKALALWQEQAGRLTGGGRGGRRSSAPAGTAGDPDTWQEISLDSPVAQRLPDLKRKLSSMAWRDDPDVVPIIDYTLSQAIVMHASDVHFEPGPDELGIRFRVDGTLVDVVKLPRDIHGLVINRLKVMSRLSSYTHNVPQDGRVFAEIGGRTFDIRISLLSTLHGEKAALRLFDTGGKAFELDHLGLGSKTMGAFCELLTRPQGIIFVTGPTGSGKTTTMYASLRHIKTTSAGMVNIVTLEDPVEFAIADFSQTQVNEETGLTFAKGLRTILRQDPDVIMVGEIRDGETAQIALQAGLTGHLLITTVHADSSAGVFSRLTNMGMESFLLSSATAGVLSQRLVRVLCPKCKRPATLTDRQRRMLLESGIELGDEVQLQTWSGCDSCLGTGYRGRTVLAELMIVNEAMQQAIIARAPAGELHRISTRNGMRTLLENGLTKALQGETSVDEVLRVTR